METYPSLILFVVLIIVQVAVAVAVSRAWRWLRASTPDVPDSDGEYLS